MNTTPAVDAVGDAQTLLFVPGDRPGLFDKAATSGADGVILDLEDAVAGPDKEAARSHVAAWLTDGAPAAVRINAFETPWFSDDLAAVRGSGCAVMLPKATRDGVAAVVARLGTRTRVLALLETAIGIADALAICRSPNVIRAAFGSIDFSTEIGVDPNDREALLHARSILVLASAAGNLAPPLDGVTTNHQHCWRARRCPVRVSAGIHRQAMHSSNPDRTGQRSIRARTRTGGMGPRHPQRRCRWRQQGRRPHGRCPRPGARTPPPRSTRTAAVTGPGLRETQAPAAMSRPMISFMISVVPP
jgi:hypothetical protein